MNAAEALADFKRSKPKLNHQAPEPMRHLDALFEASPAEVALPTKEKDLSVWGIAVATHRQPCILVHLEGGALAATKDKGRADAGTLATALRVNEESSIYFAARLAGKSKALLSVQVAPSGSDPSKGEKP